ncbi:amidase domain-containing protein [Paenactinomyces guangxiensis]|uniref:Amidase domain-containing protein n=1 Tax=Paenactinomyces guangxiensis TaxID=1490290 RepID=A0A7W1WUS3_9BACL|nr:amidase domain-containing protein [Paenactinomyces guangxiensis]MBA4496363.1 amidase domain-containing protein [Paenactinomyces guangxiensis]MBH8593604.1 amidase domain-containing protein [Paenactinomyces guangxiensis]
MGKYFHQLTIIILLAVVGAAIVGSGHVYADPVGPFEVPPINDDFDAGKNAPAPQSENGGFLNSLKEFFFGKPRYITYNRKKAIEYAQKWSDPNNPGKLNPKFERFDSYGLNLGGDCANFVLQMLLASGLEMNDDWYYKKENKDDFINKIPKLRNWFGYFSPEWAVAHDQFEYFSDKDNGFAVDTYEITSLDDLKKYSGKVKPGDLLYWDNSDNGDVDHATMITNIENGRLKYSAHTGDRYNADVYDKLAEKIDSGETPKLYIVKMKDKFEVE